MEAKDIMTTQVVTVRPDTSIVEIINLLVEHRISGVPVLDDKENVVGLVTEHDLIYKKRLPVSPFLMYHYGEYNLDKIPEEQKENLCRAEAADVMTKDVISISEETPVEDVVTLMVEKRVKRVPVLKGNKLVGIVSRRDVLKEIFRLVCWT